MPSSGECSEKVGSAQLLHAIEDLNSRPWAGKAITICSGPLVMKSNIAQIILFSLTDSYLPAALDLYTATGEGGKMIGA